MTDTAIVEPSPTSSHPVADNPIRLLTGKGWSEAKDLQQNAKLFALQAKRGPIQLPEPCRALCPRIRRIEDYTKAAKTVSDPTAFAVAIAFLPDNWEKPRSALSQAIVGLLRAEGVARGDSRRAGWVDDALRAWDGPEGDRQIVSAVERAARETTPERQPSLDEVCGRVNEVLGQLAEYTLADLGEVLGESQIDLLSTIDSCHRLPEVRGIRAAETAIADGLWSRIENFFNFAGPFIKLDAKPSQAEISALSVASNDSREAWRLSKRRPSLGNKFSPDIEMSFDAQRLLLGWAIGANCGAWEQAGKIIYEVGPQATDYFTDPGMRQLLLLALRAIPILAFAEVSRRSDLAPPIFGLKTDFPDFSNLIDKLNRGVGLLCQGKRASLADCDTPPEPTQSRKPPKTRQEAPAAKPAENVASKIPLKTTATPGTKAQARTTGTKSNTHGQVEVETGDIFTFGGVRYIVVGADHANVQMRPENVSQDAPPLVVPQSVVTSKLANGSGKLEKISDNQGSPQSTQPLHQTSQPPKAVPVAEPEVSPKPPPVLPSSTTDIPRQPAPTTSTTVPRTDSSGAAGYVVAVVVVLIIILIVLFNLPSGATSNVGTGGNSTVANTTPNQANVEVIPQSGSSASTTSNSPYIYSSTPAENPQADNAQASTPSSTIAPEASFEIMVGGHKYRVPQIRFDEIETDRQAIVAQASKAKEFTTWLETERKNLAVLQQQTPLMNSNEVIAWNQRMETYNTTATQGRAVRKKLDQLTDAYIAKIKRYGKRLR